MARPAWVEGRGHSGRAGPRAERKVESLCLERIEKAREGAWWEDGNIEGRGKLRGES